MIEVEDSGMYYPEEITGYFSNKSSVSCVTDHMAIAEAGTVDDDLKMIFGFVPLTKIPIIICGEGGALLTHDRRIFERAQCETIASALYHTAIGAEDT